MGTFLDSLKRARQLASIARTARQTTHADDATREAARQALAVLLADARGIPMKVGQFLASFEGQEALAPLSKGVAPLPLEAVLPSIEQALGAPLETIFSAFSEEAVGASLGQVHRARLRKENVDVAVKVQYPHIGRAVQAEMALAKLLPGMGPARRWGFDVAGYKAVLHENMVAELDYRVEAQHQAKYHRAMRLPGLSIPRPYPAYVRENILVQDYLEGSPIQAAATWSPEERRSLGDTLLATLFRSLFVTGLVHGDPHFGNLRFTQNAPGPPQVMLFDYGCMIAVGPTERLALLKLIVACVEHRAVDPMACYCAMGFDPEKLAPIQQILPALSEVLFEPFRERGPFDTRHWMPGTRIDALLGELKWWFRSAGPPRLLLLMRAFQGLVAQLEALEVAVNWRQILTQTVGAAMLEEARACTLPGPPEVASSAIHFASIARYLQVRVTEGDVERLALTMPAGQTAILSTLIPPDVLARVTEAGIDVAAIAREACHRGLVPQELFSIALAGRHYRIWLE